MEKTVNFFEINGRDYVIFNRSDVRLASPGKQQSANSYYSSKFKAAIENLHETSCNNPWEGLTDRPASRTGQPDPGWPGPVATELEWRFLPPPFAAPPGCA